MQRRIIKYADGDSVRTTRRCKMHQRTDDSDRRENLRPARSDAEEEMMVNEPVTFWLISSVERRLPVDRVRTCRDANASSHAVDWNCAISA